MSARVKPCSLPLLLPLQTVTQMVTEASGFVTIVCGTFILHATKDLDIPLSAFVQLTKAGGGSGSKLVAAAAVAAAGTGGDGNVELGLLADSPQQRSGRGGSAYVALKRDVSSNHRTEQR